MSKCFEVIPRFFLLLIFLVSLPSVVSSKPLTITVSEYPPYHSKDLPGFGINAQIVTAAFESQDISIDYKQMNTWKEAFDYAAQGKADAAALWEYNQAHEEDFLISEPVYKISAHFFFNNLLDFSWRNVSDLKGYTISALIGGYYGDGGDTVVIHSGRTLVTAAGCKGGGYYSGGSGWSGGGGYSGGAGGSNGSDGGDGSYSGGAG